MHIGKHRLDRFRFLFFAILMMIGLRPIITECLSGGIWLDVVTDVFFAGALLAGLMAVKSQPKQFWMALILVCTITLLGLIHYTMPIKMLDKLQLGLGAVFFIQMLVMITTHIKNETQVTLDLIMAAACSYVLLGMIWAYAYYFLESFHPHSFAAGSDVLEELWDFHYYSFVTLTTVGYGDILAKSKSAQALTVLEAIVGQLYLAILISRLVGLHASQLQSDIKK